MNENQCLILGYPVFIGDINNVLNGVFKKKATEKLFINTINPHSYAVARKDTLFQKALRQSSYLVPDGIGIIIALRLLRGIKKERLTGSDIHSLLLEKANEYGLKVFYFGSSKPTLEKIEAKIRQQYPNISVGSYSPPFKSEFDITDNKIATTTINAFDPDILFVGMTAPKQEKWSYTHRDEINATITCSVGAVFDFFAGTKKRSSSFWQNIGLEWLPRLIMEPRRLYKRIFISGPIFFWDVIKELLTIKRE